MERIFAEPAAAFGPPLKDSSLDSHTHLAAASSSSWELVLSLGLQTLHRWQSAPKLLDLQTAQPQHLDALLFLASMPSMPSMPADRTNADTGGDNNEQQQPELSQQQQHLAESLDQLTADLLTTSSELELQSGARWVAQRITQRVLPTATMSQSGCDNTKLMQIAAHFLMQYSQRAQQAQQGTNETHLVMVLWTDLIVSVCMLPAQLPKHVGLPR